MQNISKYRILQNILLLFSLASFVFADEVWLLINPETRYASLAGAATAIVNDVAALYYNPAGLANCDELSASANYGTWLGNSEIYYAGAVRNFKHRGGLGTSLYLYNLDAKITGDDYTATDFSYNFIYVSIGYGCNFTRKITLGAATKFIYTNAPNTASDGIQSINGKGLACDLGIQINNLLPFLTIGENKTGGLSLGAAFCNLGPAIKYRNDFTNYKSKLVPRLRLGGGWRLLNKDLISATISYDFIEDYYDSNSSNHLKSHLIGGAFSFYKRLYIHCGQHIENNENYITWGAAYNLDKFIIGYCRYPSQKSNFFSVSYSL
ncbi:MAG TPA: PorV/PorQ family protein [Candidatus Marinimicrobia bacterium]|nr:PorV/PorQ family protein [Candidatus Neomarinimicrobiota bacterium]